MFCYMFAFMFTSVVEQEFFVQKACRVNHNFSAEICANINANENKAYKEQVLDTTASFHQWENIAAHVFPIIIALFLGSFSDRRGRKFPLLLGLVGKLIYSTMIVVNAKMTSWPVEYIIYTATLPSAVTGADVAIFASCFAYISDITTLAQRTIRVTILDVIYLMAIPTGVALGSYMFYNVFNESYADMFAVNASLLALAILYSLVVLKVSLEGALSLFPHLSSPFAFLLFSGKPHSISAHSANLAAVASGATSSISSTSRILLQCWSSHVVVIVAAFSSFCSSAWHSIHSSVTRADTFICTR